MTPPGRKFSDIDDYIASFPVETREILEQLRETVRKMVKFRVEENKAKK
jgi:hypothetical protein